MIGAFFDLACLNFRLDFLCADPSRGNCWVYDNFQLSWSIVSVIMIGIGANFIFSFLTWHVYPKQNVSGNPPLNNQSSIELNVTEKKEGKKLETKNNQPALASVTD